MQQVKTRNVLLLNASARGAASNSRALAGSILEQLEQRHGALNVVERDVSQGLPVIDEQWVGANFTPSEQRTPEQHQRLALSDELISELVAADIVVIGAPMYNFSVPASLKAWIDLVARAGVTFRYTEQGPQGLLRGKQAYVVVTTGGAQIGSASDFASGYLKHILGFIGIHDVQLIEAERYDASNVDKYELVQTQIAQRVKAGAQQLGQVA